MVSYEEYLNIDEFTWKQDVFILISWFSVCIMKSYVFMNAIYVLNTKQKPWYKSLKKKEFKSTSNNS